MNNFIQENIRNSNTVKVGRKSSRKCTYYAKRNSWNPRDEAYLEDLGVSTPSSRQKSRQQSGVKSLLGP